MSNFERILFEQNYNYVKKLMILYCCDTQLAEEFTQEAFYRAFKNIRQLREPDYFKSWVYQIAINEARKYFKKNKKIVLMDPNVLKNHLNNLGGLENIETKMYISDLLGELDSDSRAILLLYYFNDQSVAKIAKALSIREGTVKSRLHRAREKFRTLLDVEEESQVIAYE